MSTPHTDTALLEWLIAEGYISELRRVGERDWYFETADANHHGETARAAIGKAMDAEEEKRR